MTLNKETKPINTVQHLTKLSFNCKLDWKFFILLECVKFIILIEYFAMSCLSWVTVAYIEANSNYMSVPMSVCVCVHTYISSSSSSCGAASTDILEPLSPLLPIIHRFWQVFRTTSRILT